MEFFNISIHDVTKSSLGKVEKLKAILTEEGITKISYLLVPKYHEKEELTDIKEVLPELLKNGEAILHGYTHKGKEYFKFSPMKLFTSNEGEFISFQNLEKRIENGTEILKQLNISPSGFIPPAWLIKSKTIKILKKKGFEFTTNRYFIFDLKKARKIFSPVISFSCREPIQRISKETFLLQTDLYARFLKAIRIAIHPCDADDREKIEIIRKGIKDLKKLGENAFLKEIIEGG